MELTDEDYKQLEQRLAVLREAAEIQKVFYDMGFDSTQAFGRQAAAISLAIINDIVATVRSPAPPSND